MLLTYVDDLSNYSADNVSAGLDAIASVPRGEHEPVIPDTATILGAVRGVIRARRPSAEQEAADRWIAYIAAAKAEGVTEPDEETMQLIAKLNERLSL